jgi:hypothetical protein
MTQNEKVLLQFYCDAFNCSVTLLILRILYYTNQPIELMKLFTLSILLLITIAASADMVGNKPRPSCSISFANVDTYKNYTFYYTRDRNDEVLDETKSVVINNKTVIDLRGGYGAPDYIMFYAKNKKTGINTEKIYLSNDHEDYILSVDTIENNKIYHSISHVKKANQKTSGFISNSNFPYQAGMLGISGFSLIGLLFFYHFKRKL